MKDIKQKKKEEKHKEMERNVRRSPHVIDIKRFYKESSSSEEERKKTKKAVPKIGSPRKVVCRLILAWSVSSWQRDPGCFFCFLVGVPLESSGHSHFQAIFKTSDTEVNLLHVFSDRVSRDAKKIEEGGQGEGHADEASFLSGLMSFTNVFLIIFSSLLLHAFSLNFYSR